MAGRPPWQRYVDAATAGGSAQAAQHTAPGALAEQPPAVDVPDRGMPHAARRRSVRLRTGIGSLSAAALAALSRPAPPDQPRRTIDLRLVPAALAAWAAALLCVRLDPAAAHVVAAAALSAAAATIIVCVRRCRPLISAALPLCCLALVSLSAAQTVTSTTAGPIAAAISGGAAVTAELRVTSEPDQSANPDHFSGAPRYLIAAELRSATADGARFAARTPVLVLADERWQTVQPGQTVEAAGVLVAAEPGAEVRALLAARTAPLTKVEAPGWQQWITQLREDFRASCMVLSKDAAGLLPGMVLGDRTGLAAELENDMKRTGLTHLTAVSGANCSILIGFVVLAAYALRLPRWSAAVTSLMALAGFVLLVGPDPSVLRAALMGTIGIAAVLSGRGRRSASFLSTAVVVLLVLDPWLSANYAFVLSVLATTGLIVFGHSCARWLAQWLPWWLAQALAVPIAAQVFCSPVIILLQPQLITYSVIANVLAAPLIAPITIVGMFAVLAVAVYPPAAVPLTGAAGAAAHVVAVVARFFSAAPGAALPWPQGPFGAALLAVLGLTMMALIWILARRRTRAARPDPGDISTRPGRRHASVRWYLGAVVLGAVLGGGPALLITGAGPHHGAQTWSLVACDVGQGDALVLRTGPASAILVDAGPEPEAIDRCLRRLRVSTIDLLVLTHMHIDHSGGLAGALKGRTVHRVLASSARDYLPEPVAALLEEHSLITERAAAGQTGVSGPVHWRVLWPLAAGAGEDENNASVVLAARIASQGGVMNVLLTGDLEEAGLAGLLAVPTAAAPGGAVPGASSAGTSVPGASVPGASVPGTQAPVDVPEDALALFASEGLDVLKIAHHGAQNGGTSIIEGLDPAVALISVGRGNDYGHPHPRILQSLEEAGSAVGRTDQDGIIYVHKEDQVLLMWSTK